MASRAGRDREKEPCGPRLCGHLARGLVERFDTELFSDFSAESSNFKGLVLSCIDADFCVQILILQHFSRSTRFAILCTAPNSKSQPKFDQLFFQISAEISAFFSTIFMEVSTDFDENSSAFREIF